MYHLSRAWYWHLGTTIPWEDGTKFLVPPPPERSVTKIIYCRPLRGWYWNLCTTVLTRLAFDLRATLETMVLKFRYPQEHDNEIYIPPLLRAWWRNTILVYIMVTEFQYHIPFGKWYLNFKNGTEILLPSVKFVLHHRQSYLSLILSSHRKCCDHATANAKILFTGLFRIASTAPSPATPHIWKFPTPRSSSRGCAAWSALTVWHSEHANYTIPGRFPSIFFAITYVYSLCVLLIGCILPVVAVRSEKII